MCAAPAFDTGFDTEQPQDTLHIVDAPLLVLVGVTGVGKSTTLAALQDAGFAYTLLPDRRVLTDDLIIARIQAEEGEERRPVTDRRERFGYTRRYRERYGGGMAHALTSLRVDGEIPADHHLLFDGLRGADEVRYAAEHMPQARFLVLDAPDVVRVERLLNRADAFDQVTAGAKIDASNIFDDLPGVDELFAPAEQQHLLSLVAQGRADAADLRAKLSIVITERRNYDPSAAIAELTRIAPTRTLVVNTADATPGEVARRIVNWCVLRSA
ncbi:MAG: hypothetical protein R2873_28660 [Caldilineaceae bacterium]